MKSDFNNSKQSTKGSISDNFGNSLRDDVLLYKLENETGYELAVTKEDDGYLYIELLSKSGKSLGGGRYKFSATNNKVVVDTTTTNLTCLCENGSIYRCGKLSSLTISSLIVTIEQEYNTSIVFSSGESATIFIDNMSIKFTGDNCENGTFTPITNTMYELNIWFNGFSFQGTVRGTIID